MARCYVRNGVWGWSIPEQVRALVDAGVWEPGTAYTDELPAHRARMPARVQPEWLEERKRLLRPTARQSGEAIYVATILTLGVNERDLIATLAAAASRGTVITAMDSGLTFTAAEGIVAANAAIQDWHRAREATRTKPGRIAGNIAAAEAKKARTLKKLPEARRLWRLPTSEIATEEIARRVELSTKTLYTYLGRREVAQRRRKSRGKS